MVEEFESLGATVSLRMQPGGHTISPQHVREIAAEL
jgi:predicted esterase